MAKVSYKDIAQAVVGSMESHGLTGVSKGLAAYLVSEQRVSELGKIMREVESIRHETLGILEVDVSSARALTADIEAQIQKMFDEKTIHINSHINKNLVGGVRLQAQDTLIDLSIRGQLNKLKTHNF